MTSTAFSSYRGTRLCLVINSSMGSEEDIVVVNYSKNAFYQLYKYVNAFMCST